MYTPYSDQSTTFLIIVVLTHLRTEAWRQNIARVRLIGLEELGIYMNLLLSPQ
jgi:hypothetical protein